MVDKEQMLNKLNINQLAIDNNVRCIEGLVEKVDTAKKVLANHRKYRDNLLIEAIYGSEKV